MHTRSLLVLGWIAALAFPAAAETQTFQVRLAGLPVGELVLAVNENGQAYAASGLLRTTGLVGLLAKVRFEMRARGRGQLPDPVAVTSYSEDLDTGYRASQVNLAFGGGDRRVDPLTAILAGLVDRAPGTGCHFDRATWDGVRSMRVTIGAGGAADGNALVCSGVAIRLSGYSAEEMAEAVRFPFTVRFADAGDALQATRADIRTIHGPVTLVRR